MDISKAFDGYDVPENIKAISAHICKRFTINGECDPMYICNWIGKDCGIGDGCGHFTGNTITDAHKLAERIQWAYGCNIIPAEVDELTRIINGEVIPKEQERIGMLRHGARIMAERNACCDSWRREYLTGELDTITNALQNYGMGYCDAQESMWAILEHTA